MQRNNIEIGSTSRTRKDASIITWNSSHGTIRTRSASDAYELFPKETESWKMTYSLKIEAVRWILALSSHILQPFADGHHSIGCNAIEVDAHGIIVKNVMLINGDCHRTHSSIQSLIVNMFKKAKYRLFANRKTYFMALPQQKCSKNIVINIRFKNLSFPT